MNYKLALRLSVLIVAGWCSSLQSHAQTPGAVRASPEIEASVKRLPIEGGSWEMRRSDVRGGQPYAHCMTQGDWETTKLRAIGGGLVPPGCRVSAVSLKGTTVTTQFTCPDRKLVEELEFSGKTFRSRATETSLASGKMLEVVEGSGKFIGACK